jgi:hypothetical protein
MMDTARRKRVTAAIAAVSAYLQYEQEAGVAVPEEKPAAAPAAPVRLWGISGRQAQMHNRTLMQMRAFK